jgi:hypothetical protein
MESRLVDSAPRRGWAAKLVLPAVLAVIILGMVSPLAANAYKKRQLAEHELAVVGLIKEYRQAQAKYQAAHGEPARKFSDLELSVQPADMDVPKSGATDGYRFRIVPSGSAGENGFDLLAVPATYGITGWHTFFLSGHDIYYADLSVKTDRIVQGLVSLPANATRIQD